MQHSTRSGSRADVNARDRQQSFGFSLIELLVVVSVIALLVAFFLPSVRRAGPAARRTHCRVNLRQIGIALHEYHDAYGAFPPAYTVDADGNRLHSWRTLILPFFDTGLPDELHDCKIDPTKPWDDPANAKALANMESVFHCPSADIPQYHTTYLAVVTPNSCLRPARPRPLSEVTDHPGQTLMVIEVPLEHAVPWMAPQDADEQMVLDIGSDSDLSHPGEFFAAFVDGRVLELSAKMPASERRALISVAGNDNDSTVEDLE